MNNRKIQEATESPRRREEQQISHGPCGPISDHEAPREMSEKVRDHEAGRSSMCRGQWWNDGACHASGRGTQRMRQLVQVVLRNSREQG